jgi:hypothetical protein
MRSGLALGLVAAMAAGCGFHRSAAASDAGADDIGPGCTSFASLLDTCQLAFSRDLTIAGAASYNSISQTLLIAGATAAIDVKTVMIGGDPVDVISVRSLELSPSATLRAVGPHALAIVASDHLTVSVDSQIDVSDGGAGAQAACTGGAMAGENSSNGAGGGGGGGFGADGGTGGNGDLDGGAPFKAGGPRGHAVGELPAGVHGGCPGASGGNGDAAGGAGGGGGGALYLVAGHLIQLDSSAPINAGGGGGHGGDHNANGGDAGGGGGGSGGMIILEAPQILAMSATIAANGGGGGEGSESAGNAGAPGNPGTLRITRADGGGGNSQNGADGGLGGSVDGPAGDPPAQVLNGGGGGGGGGVGIIRVLSPDAHIGTLSPAAR